MVGLVRALQIFSEQNFWIFLLKAGVTVALITSFSIISPLLISPWSLDIYFILYVFFVSLGASLALAAIGYFAIRGLLHLQKLGAPRTYLITGILVATLMNVGIYYKFSHSTLPLPNFFYALAFLTVIVTLTFIQISRHHFSRFN